MTPTISTRVDATSGASLRRLIASTNTYPASDSSATRRNRCTCDRCCGGSTPGDDDGDMNRRLTRNRGSLYSFTAFADKLLTSDASPTRSRKRHRVVLCDDQLKVPACTRHPSRCAVREPRLPEVWTWRERRPVDAPRLRRDVGQRSRPHQRAGCSSPSPTGQP